MLMRRRFHLSMTRREAMEGYLFILPWAIGYLLFRLGPLLASLYLSFTNSAGTFFDSTWVGFENYVYMFTQDPRFIDSLRSTLLFVAGYLPLNLLLGLGVAVLMNQGVRGILIFRGIYYLPSVTTGVAVALLWGFVFHKQYGILNAILSWVNIKPVGWLVDPDWVMQSFIIMSLWGVGGTMIVYLAGLQAIPTDINEAATIDGANRFKRFFSITLPLLTPTIFFNLVTGMIGAFQIFENAYIMTSGGPNYRTYFFGLNIYFTSFQSLRFGYSSTIAWILFILIATLTILVMTTSRRWVYYASEK
ncbi:MAG: sugar ABC transporter permease [Anaerolineaceae bacterium]|nr:sugar ABC transporter permease [Anaerolineaceae bacterium]